MDDKIEQQLDEIKQLLEFQTEQLRERALYVSPTTVILNSSNLQQLFDSSYRYDIKMALVGSPTSDVIVALNVKAKNIATHTHIHLNTSQPVITLRGLNLSSVSVLASTISTYSVYITYIGYKEYKKPELV